MNVLVTGAAGFVGSHLCSRLLREGHSVTGVDCFTNYYPKWIKEKNLQSLLALKNFKFIPEDINSTNLKLLLKDVNILFHQAAQAGVRASWGQNFDTYTRNNIEGTQKLLEAARETSLQKFIYASSSSVYGRCPELPMSETSPLYPCSPYGVSKLAAEHLCSLYFKNFDVPTVSLRYFTVFGPGQRPDMAFHKFLKAQHENSAITIFGDGEQTRDFTYIDDIIDANITAMEKGKPGEIYNIGGGNRRTLKTIFPLLEQITEKPLKINWENKQKGDAPHTFADIRKAKKNLDYLPRVSLEDGLEEQWKWIRELLSHEEGITQ